ncbi:MAG: hypothetical protein HZA52_21365 [Planctomycetes bacterium]|nr:hypothetical protein [Planctomycetota bacterium]
MRVRVLGLLCASCVALGLLLWFQIRRHSTPTATQGNRDAATANAVSPVGDPDARPAVGLDADPSTNERVDVVTALNLSLRVLDAEQQPIPDAEVTLTPIPVLAATGEWFATDWAALDRETLTARSRADGGVTLRLPDEWGPDRPVALAVTAPHFHAYVRGFPGASDLATFGTIELRRAESRLRVLGNELTSGEQVRVEIFGSVALRQRGSRPARDVDACRVFHRVITVSGQEWREIFATDEHFALVAKLGALVAPQRVGPLLGDVSVVLLPSFRLRGEVSEGGARFGGEFAEVMAEPHGTYDASISIEVPVRPDGTFGPVDCPISGTGRMGFYLLSASCLPQYLTVDPPAVGSEIFVRFDCEASGNLDVRITDSNARPVGQAAVGASWTVDSLGQTAIALPALSDADGIARLVVPQEGAVRVRARKGGYATEEEGPVLVTADGERQVDVVLQKGGRIEGRVTFGGQPVTDFDIAYFPPLQYADLATQRFEGRSDGRFVIEDVRVRPLMLYARSDEYPRSEPVSVAFSEDVAGPYDLALAPPCRGFGHIVDSDTRQPIAQASAWVWNSWEGQLMTPQAEPAPADGNGRFEVAELRPGDNTIWIQAPGYHWLMPQIVARESDEQDLGVFPVDREVPITVQLESVPRIDFTEYSLRADVMLMHGPEPFGPDGRLSIPGCGIGQIRLLIDYPDGSLVTIRRWIHRAVPNTIRHRIESEFQLRLTARSRGNCIAREGDNVAIAYDDGTTDVMRWLVLDADGGATIDRLPRRTLDVWVYSGEEVIASCRYEPTLDREQSLEVALDCRRKRLRVLDADGRPHGGAQALLTCAGDEVRSRFELALDEQGEVEFAWPPCADVVLSVLGNHPRLACKVHIDEQPEQVVRLGPDATLRVQLRDGATPLRGYRLAAVEPVSVWPLAPGYTDSSGTATWECVGATAYEVRAEDQGLWSARVSLLARDPSEPPQVLQVRRTGRVVLDVRGSLGEAVAGARAVLTSAEFGESTDQWLADGRLGSVEPESDTAGRVAFVGLPNGEYAWSVTAADGRASSGTVAIPPAGEARVEALLAD